MIEQLEALEAEALAVIAGAAQFAALREDELPPQPIASRAGITSKVDGMVRMDLGLQVWSGREARPISGVPCECCGCAANEH